MTQVYQQAEDSSLLSEVLKKQLSKLLDKNPELNFLEIGVGSGIQLETALNLSIKNENIFGCDINPNAIKHCKKLGFNCIKSNLFENIGEKFDIIIFNPPYLPEDKNEPKDSRLATTGGKNGSEVINKFLKQAKKHLKKDGKIFVLVSSLTKGINFKCYRKKIVGRKKIFFEELIVLKLSLKI